MKKASVFLAMFVMVTVCVGSENRAFSQNLSDAEAETAYLREKTLSRDKTVKSPSNLSKEDFQNILNGISSGDKGERNSARVWFSSDPDDLKPLIGAKLVMAYKIGSTVFADVLTFGSDSEITTTTEGSVCLSVSDQNNTMGVAFYTDSPQGGRGFSAVLMGTSLRNMYYFKINGNVANGIYLFQSVSSGTFSIPYSLTGIKWGGVIGDINGDNKIGLAEVVYDLQILSGIRTE
jgi:hypothetical protein